MIYYIDGDKIESERIAPVDYPTRIKRYNVESEREEIVKPGDPWGGF